MAKNLTAAGFGRICQKWQDAGAAVAGAKIRRIPSLFS